MKVDNAKLTPGIYILTCLKSIGYDCCLFVWEEGNQYRLQIKENGDIVTEAEGLLFTPTNERLEEMLKCFKVEADFNNKVDVYKYFFQKRTENTNGRNNDK